MDGWERRALRAAEFVACPALAGAAFCLLALGVVTWLPALAATACTLQQWRTDGAGRCFTGVFAAFGRNWRELWRESLAATALMAVLTGNTLFLLGSHHPAAYVLLPVQGCLLAALALAGVALAAVSATEPPHRRRRAAALLAFGSPGRGLMMLAVLVIAPLAVLPIPLGPLLLGPTLPVLFALSLHTPVDPRTRKVSHA